MRIVHDFRFNPFFFSLKGVVVVDLTMDYGQNPSSENYLHVQKYYYYAMRNPTPLFAAAIPALIVVTLGCLVAKIVRHKNILDLTTVACLLVALAIFQLHLIPDQAELAQLNPTTQREKVQTLASSIAYYHLLLSPFLLFGTMVQGYTCLITYTSRKKTE